MILWRGQFWRIELKEGYTLPGYLVIGCSGASKFDELDQQSSREMGETIQLATSALEKVLSPRHVLAGRFGLIPGNPIHYHVVPIYDWVEQAFKESSDYIGLDQLNPPDYPVHPDGALLLAFVWREMCVRKRHLIEYDPHRVRSILKAELAKR